MFSVTKAISEESLIDKLIELNISKATENKSLTELITELDDTELLQKLFEEPEPENPISPRGVTNITEHYFWFQNFKYILRIEPFGKSKIDEFLPQNNKQKFEIYTNSQRFMEMSKHLKHVDLK